jgi:hypothetical protein
MKINSENYFEIAEALHCYLTLNYEGQGSEKYEYLCKSDFRPGLLWSENKVIKENCFYAALTEENWKKIFDDLTEFLKEKEN